METNVDNFRHEIDDVLQIPAAAVNAAGTILHAKAKLVETLPEIPLRALGIKQDPI